MKCEVEPSEVSSVLKFSSSSYSSHINENIETTYGLISKSGLWLYIVHDTIINIYCTETGKWQGGHSFAESLKNPSAKIRAAAEFTSIHISFPCLILAVEQDHESLLCMFDVSLCKVVQAILLPDKITSLDIVSGNGGVCIETHYLCRRLRCMFGIVAVGTLHGHIFFLDLCLDEDFGCDEKLPNITAVVKKNDFTPQKREMAISKKQHIFLHLNEESTSGSSFEFKSRCSVLGRFANGDVSVTAIKYIQSLTTLTVGFNFGGIQLWDLHTLMLQFTVSDDQHEQAIVRFAFQEPENDPRNFCYLWVVKGHSVSEEDLPSSVSVATLYSLTYLKRDYREEFGALYTELQTCNKRFELPLTNGAFSPTSTAGTRLLSCQVISQRDEPHALSPASHNDSELVSEDMSVCFLSWEVWPDAEHLPPSYHLAIFDLNQWYQAHMPFNFRCNPNELNSYLGIFSLEEISRKFSNDVMGLYTVPQSVKKFKSLSVSEEFFYPSSLGFQLMCFSENGQCKATYFGFQRHLLFEIAELGPKVLLNPKEIYSSLIKSGLVTDLHGGVERTPLNVQKESILQLALEYYMPFFFMKCLKEWRYSDSIHEGCTSKAILSWAWKKVINIKNSIDRLSVPLFNCSGTDIDKASLKQLYSFRRQLTLIDSIIEGYQEYVTPRTEQGIQELQCRKEVITSINMYLRVLLWLRSVQILPEVCEEEATAKSIVYRISQLEDSFSVRRSRLNKLHSSLAADDVFLVDGMVAESGIGSSWLEKNGTGVYPPPSIYAALGCYLADGVSIASKHALIFYLLLDLQNMNAENQVSAELKKFPSIFGMSKGMVKLVKAFWCLDRKDSENAIKKLLHPAVRLTDIQPWQHQRIVKSFLYWREPQKALKYVLHMEPPQSNIEDMKLHLSVLLACGAITQAYEYQRKKQILGYGNELANHLFLGCQETQKLKDLMYLPLNSFESSALIKFLSESEDPKAQESLVIYHLLHCNFFQAEKVNEKLSRALMNKLASIYEATTYERTVDRDALVENLMAAISKPERYLVEEIKQFPSGSMRIEETSQPLSASVKRSTFKAVTCSDIIEALLHKSFRAPGGLTPNTPTNAKSSSYYQDLPFLGPPVTPECIKQQFSFKSGSSAIAKRSRLSSSPTEISSPAKRSRLLDTTPFVSSPLSKKKAPKNLASDIVSLLQTPPIHRKSSVPKSGGLQSTPTVTPQSILKKKTETKKQMALDLHLAATPPLVSEEESSEEVMIIDEKEQENVGMADVETPSRQIRFDLPDSPDSDPPPIPYPKVSEEQHKDATLSESYSYGLGMQSDASAHEVGVKSILNLTREPLRGRKKDISFHEEVLSIARDDSSMEVEERVKVPKIVSSIYERSVPTFSFASDRGNTSAPKPSTPSAKGCSTDISFHKEVLSIAKDDSSMEVEEHIKVPKIVSSIYQRSVPTFSFASDRGNTSSPKPSTPSDKGCSADLQEQRSSTNEVPLSPAASLFERLIHRSSYHSFQSPSKSASDIFSSQVEESEELHTGMEEISEEKSSSIIQRDVCVTPPTIITIDLEEEEEEHSDSEMFYSPSADNANFDQQPFTFSQPINLFPEISDTIQSQQPLEEEKHIDFIETDYSFKDNSNDSDKTITFAFSEPSSNDSVEDISMFKSEVPVNAETSHAESQATLEKSLKPPRRTFIFSKANPVVEDVEPETAPEVVDTVVEEKPAQEVDTVVEERPTQEVDTVVEERPAQEVDTVVEEKRAQEVDFAFKTPMDIDKTSRKSRTFVFGKKFTAMQTLASETRLQDENVQQSEISEVEPSFSFKTPSTKEISNPSMTFTVSKKAPAEEVESVLQELNKSDSQLKSDSQTPMDVQTSIEENRRISKYNFTFTKPGSSETDKLEEKRMRSESSMPASDISSFSFLSDVKSRPSRRTFVFSKKVPSSESLSVQANETEIKDSLLQSSESQSKDRGDFIKAASETYEEFSTSLKKKSSKEGLHLPDGKSLSSPHGDSPTESTQLETSSPITATDTKKTKSLKKKHPAKEKVSKAVGTTPGLTKTKGKLSQKPQFSFAEPHSPATPEILEALAQTTPEGPLPSFLFSPPLTRGRLRKKRMDETMEGSFCSVASESSFARPATPPPVDPILEGIIAGRTLAAKKPRSSAKKRSVVRKPMSQSQLDTSDMSFVSNTSLSESIINSPSKRNSSARDTSMRHSMVLRQTKAKHKPDNLF